MALKNNIIIIIIRSMINKVHIFLIALDDTIIFYELKFSSTNSFFCLFVIYFAPFDWNCLFLCVDRYRFIDWIFFFIPAVSGSTIYFRVFLRLILLFKIYEIFFLSLSLLTIIFSNILQSVFVYVIRKWEKN